MRRVERGDRSELMRRKKPMRRESAYGVVDQRKLIGPWMDEVAA